MIIKSNSIILAIDTSPSFVSNLDFPYKLGDLLPIGFVNTLSYDVSNTRSRMKQISSDNFAYDSLQFSPTININFGYTTSSKFNNENSLGLLFGVQENFQSIFSRLNGFSFNLYFIISDDFPFDLIQKIKTQGNLHNLNCLSFGNCYLTNYSLELSAGSLPQTSISVEAYNMELSTITSDVITCPAINLEVGNKNNGANVLVKNATFIENLNSLNNSLLGNFILPTYNASIFQANAENIQTPSINISGQTNSAIKSINLSIDIDREKSYGFDSNFIYDSKIKFPLMGTLDIEATAFDLHTGDGNSTGVMKLENNYNVELNFEDILSKNILISGAKLQSNTYSLDLTDNLTSKLSFSFQANPSGTVFFKATAIGDDKLIITKDIFSLVSQDSFNLETSDGYFFSI